MSGKPYDALKYDMKNNAAIVAKVSKRIYHALKPQSAQLPNITFFESGLLRFKGIENQSYTVNCRARTPAEAMDLARLVWNLFGGADGGGTTGTVNGFDMGRVSVETGSGVIPEGNSVYNAPLIIPMVYASSTVS